MVLGSQALEEIRRRADRLSGRLIYLKYLPLFLISATFETTTHICLKHAAQKGAAFDGVSYYFYLAKSKWVWLGILIYVLQIGTWVTILSAIPLSIAFPMTGIEKIIIVVVALAGLREKLSRPEWMALALIGAGVVLVGASVNG